MTLALLLTAVTGAWATDGVIMKELTVPSEWKTDENPLTVDEMTGFKDCSSLTDDEAKALLNSVPTGNVLIIYGAGASSNSFKIVQSNGTKVNVGEMPFPHSSLFDLKNEYKYYYTSSDAIKVAWNASTKTGTFAMPGSDVVLTPIYAKAAAFATTGTEPEVKTLQPAAAEGVIAGTDASLIAEGTGIVAFAGESTDVTQGTLMYAIGTSATEAPALTAFSATVPTAKDIADDGATVYVWYYIQGADAPEGVAATLDNTFDNTEPACLTVQVLTNKFDIQFNAANANTIEAGKATVTVGGTDKTVTEGKLQGVKMGSEVKVKANTGYKFRKVEVKKAAAAPSLNITNPVVGQVIGSDGKNYAADATLPSGVTAVAMIAYVGSETDDTDYTGGLAIALSDEGRMNWSTAKSTCEGKTAVTGAKWCLPSQNQWKAMFKANGGSESSYTGLNTAISTAGGTAFQKSCYWSSTEHGEVNAYYVYLFSGNAYFSNASKGIDYLVRAVLAF
jgi:hypothetical protein